MRYQEYKPAQSLEAYVKCFYAIDCDNRGIAEDFAFATGCMEVMFTLEGSPWETRRGGLYTRTAPVEIWGQVLNPMAFRVSGASRVFGIRLLPGTPSFLLREEIVRFNDQVTDLAAVLGNPISLLHRQLQDAGSVNEQIRLAESYLLKKLDSNTKQLDKIRLVQQVMTEIGHQDFFDNINNVAERYGITSRYLQKIFVSCTGLTPKLYMQINRFQNSLQLIHKKDLSLTDIAYACGYFDQSHFIREFRSFAGYSPSRFVPETPTTILASPHNQTHSYSD